MDVSQQIRELGYALLQRAIAAEEAAALAAQLTAALQIEGERGSPLASQGTVYAARNPLEVLPDVARLWRQTNLGSVLREVLGPNCGLVRGLFFDKPPGRSWSLPWHKDLTIAVKNNRLPSNLFTRPTLKAGIPHVIAPTELLEQMLTIRIHLDDVTAENGPLLVLPGSHRTGQEIVADETAPATIYAAAGAALAMRPLLSHASGESAPGTTRHRRILHLEFAANEQLSDGYEWFQFVRCE